MTKAAPPARDAAYTVASVASRCTKETRRGGETMRARVWIAVALVASLAACRKAPRRRRPARPTNRSTPPSQRRSCARASSCPAAAPTRSCATTSTSIRGRSSRAAASQVRQQPPAVIVKDASGPIEAVYRNDVGCTLIQTVPESDVYKQFVEPRTPTPPPSTAAWPEGEGAPAALPKDVNAAALDDAMTYAFSEPPAPPPPPGRRPPRRTSAARAPSPSSTRAGCSPSSTRRPTRRRCRSSGTR